LLLLPLLLPKGLSVPAALLHGLLLPQPLQHLLH
jgi:hypothetical protein